MVDVCGGCTSEDSGFGHEVGAYGKDYHGESEGEEFGYYGAGGLSARYFIDS